MKTKRTLFFFLAVLSVVVLFSCQKSRYCLCVSTETTPNDTMIVNNDRTLKCKHFMQLGSEAIEDGQVVRNYHSYTCTQIHKDTVPTIPNIPMEED